MVNSNLATEAMRLELSSKFQNQEFKINSRNDSNSCYIYVSWFDGVPHNEVEHLATKYELGHFSALLPSDANKVHHIIVENYITDDARQSVFDAMKTCSLIPHEHSLDDVCPSEGLKYRFVCDLIAKSIDLNEDIESQVSHYVKQEFNA